MNTVPFEKWDGVSAYFTFADQPSVLFGICVAAAAVTALSIISGAKHELECYRKVDGSP
jgi:hypothetical protein